MTPFGKCAVCGEPILTYPDFLLSGGVAYHVACAEKEKVMPKRTWTRHRILRSTKFLVTAREVTKAIDRLGFRYALIGGLAVAYHANPPVTVDADILIDTDKMDILEILFRGEGWTLYPLIFQRGGPGFPKYGWTMKKHGRTGVDLISTSDDAYLSSVVGRARMVSLSGIPMPVVRAEDLIVIKTLAGRTKDLSDVVALRKAGKLDLAYIKKTLSYLR
jgi:predicted nucleotidyltransferase